MEAAAKEIRVQIEAAAKSAGIDDLQSKLNELKAESAVAGFWNDNNHAQSVMRQIAALEKKIDPWEELLKDSFELEEIAKLADPKLKDELTQNLEGLKQKLAGMREKMNLSGPYDEYGALLSISAGAGGTDAQDWTQMLFRMYSRFFDKSGWKYRVDEESAGEEAGLKSVTIEVDASDSVYGKLKGEHGVHRLVRLSPFNADHLRQTSFAKVEVSPKIDSPQEAAIDDKDLKIDVYRSGGHGGQSVNTTDSAVRVTHLPTGISVTIQNERSQLQNKETALKILRSHLIQLQLEQFARTLSDIKGPNQSAEWGNQIRNYVLHPYKQVKDLRSHFQTSDVDGVLGGDLEALIDANLKRLPS